MNDYLFVSLKGNYACLICKEKVANLIFKLLNLPTTLIVFRGHHHRSHDMTYFFKISPQGKVLQIVF